PPPLLAAARPPFLSCSPSRRAARLRDSVGRRRIFVGEACSRRGLLAPSPRPCLSCRRRIDLDLLRPSAHRAATIRAPASTMPQAAAFVRAAREWHLTLLRPDECETGLIRRSQSASPTSAPTPNR
ncbi:unnamed protein product, partial [Urochloa humidicola]